MLHWFTDSNTKPLAWALVVCLVLLAASIVWFALIPQTDPIEQFYAKTTVVQTIDGENDTVVVKDSNGNTWTFTGVEDWEVNDVCSCLMDTKGTPSIYDDEIVSTRYDGVMLGWIIK